MRRIVNIVLMATLGVLALLGWLLAIGAETEKGDPAKPSEDVNIQISRDEIPELIEIIRVWKLVNGLGGLEEEQLVKFLHRFKELDRLKGEYDKNRRETIDRLRKLLETNSSEDQIKAVLSEFKKVEDNFHQKERQIEDALASSLTVRQQARFLVFQDTYKRDIGRLIQNLKKLSEIREKRLKRQTEAPSKK